MALMGKIRSMHFRDRKTISEIARLTSLSRAPAEALCPGMSLIFYDPQGRLRSASRNLAAGAIPGASDGGDDGQLETMPPGTNLVLFRAREMDAWPRTARGDRKDGLVKELNVRPSRAFLGLDVSWPGSWKG